jgi:subtilisin family serine protease
VSLAAPGEGIITTYPWGSFAATAGTSFSAPMVSGTVALLVGMQNTATGAQVSSAVSHAKPLTLDLGWGRLQTYETVAAGRGLWPSAPVSAVPSTCDSSGIDWSAVP